MDPLLVETRGPIGLLTLHRPDRLNAVSSDLYRALVEALDAFEADDAVRALVVTGSGRAFCAGADLVAHGEAEPTDQQRRDYIALGQTVARRLMASPLPVVAAVNGHAIGAGLELALACDLIVMAEEAKLRLPEVALGTFVGGGVVQTLPRRVGTTVARELLLTGRFFRGAEAGPMGLANRVAPAADVLDAAMELAAALAANAPVSMARMKAVLDAAAGCDLERAMELEAESLFRCMHTADWKEGIAAFHEKRAPRFEGR